MSHGKTVCRACDTVLAQCRCIWNDVTHTTRYVDSCQHCPPKQDALPRITFRGNPFPPHSPIFKPEPV